MTAEDCVTKAENENRQALINIDYCYKATCDVPRTNWEATNSLKANHWKSKKQPMAALSICEAEHIVLAKAAQEGLYLIQLLSKMDSLRECVPVKIFGNNQGVIALSRDPVHRQRCKLIDMKYHFIRDVLHNGAV